MGARRQNNIRRRPGASGLRDARLAVKGASYHLYQLDMRFKEGLSAPAEFEIFHWHVRAFFWELIAVRDVIHRAYGSDKTVKASLQQLNGEDWFAEVESYRNFAHQAFLDVRFLQPIVTNKDGQKVPGNPKYTLFPSARPGQQWNSEGVEQLRQYWQAMHNWLEAITHLQVS